MPKFTIKVKANLIAETTLSVVADNEEHAAVALDQMLKGDCSESVFFKNKKIESINIPKVWEEIQTTNISVQEIGRSYPHGRKHYA